MRKFLEYIKESNADQYFDSIFNEISKFSSDLRSSFESSIEINKRESKTQPQTQPQDTQTEKSPDISAYKKGEVYNYQGKNNSFHVRILANDGKKLKIQDIEKKSQPWIIDDTSKFIKKVKNPQPEHENV